VGRRKSRRTLEREAEQKQANKSKSVYDMSKYGLKNTKKFKKAKKRSETSVYGKVSKVRNTKRIDWI
jgi:hypothetical protein